MFRFPRRAAPFSRVSVCRLQTPCTLRSASLPRVSARKWESHMTGRANYANVSVAPGNFRGKRKTAIPGRESERVV